MNVSTTFAESTALSTTPLAQLHFLHLSLSLSPSLRHPVSALSAQSVLREQHTRSSHSCASRQLPFFLQLTRPAIYTRPTPTPASSSPSPPSSSPPSRHRDRHSRRHVTRLRHPLPHPTSARGPHPSSSPVAPARRIDNARRDQLS